MNTTRRALTWLLAASLGYGGMVQGAQAALIGTEEVAVAGTANIANGAQARLAELLQRDDVTAALRERGVSPERARERVAALTDAEAAQLAEQIDSAPAGADFLGTVVFVFVLLLITDILGFTKIFPFTRSIR